MNKIDLTNLDNLVIHLGEIIFTKIIGHSLRPVDDKPRTGISIFLEEPGTRNFKTYKVFDPSEAAVRFAIKKSDTCELLGHASSMNSADVTKLRFPGCIVLNLGEQIIHFSTSGLTGEEDVVVSTVVAHKLIGISVDEVIQNVSFFNGQFPEGLSQHGHYLKDILDEYRYHKS